MLAFQKGECKIVGKINCDISQVLLTEINAMQDKEKTNWFEVIAPWIAAGAFFAWLAWCSPDIQLWFSRF